MGDSLPETRSTPSLPARAPRVILLVTGDLLSTSRIAGLASQAGATLETLRSLTAPLPGPSYDLALLDLQGMAGDAALLVTGLLAKLEPLRTATGAAVPLIAFGPHVARDRLAAAETAGAKAAVSRGELLGDFTGIIERFCP
jgi:hypothetical protein